MACDVIRAALDQFQVCAETPHGSRLVTHCLYPSLEPVEVYVHRYGEGFRVSDLGGARREAWLHGIEDSYASRIINQEAARYQIETEAGCLVVTAQNPEWLFAAVTAVANAASNAVRIIFDKSDSAIADDLSSRLEDYLTRNFSEATLRKDYHFRGKSGKDHQFDFALRGKKEGTILINAVYSHHSSIYSNYVAFADTKIEGYGAVGRFAVYDRPLAGSDANLLAQVADLIPAKSLVAKAERMMALGFV